MSSTVKILNPVPGTVGYTTRKRADQFVGRGIAEYTRKGFLRFTSEERQTCNEMICTNTRAWAAEVPSDNKPVYDWRGSVPVWRGKALYKPGEKVS